MPTEPTLNSYIDGLAGSVHQTKYDSNGIDFDHVEVKNIKAVVERVFSLLLAEDTPDYKGAAEILGCTATKQSIKNSLKQTIGKLHSYAEREYNAVASTNAYPFQYAKGMIAQKKSVGYLRVFVKEGRACRYDLHSC